MSSKARKIKEAGAAAELLPDFPEQTHLEELTKSFEGILDRSFDNMMEVYAHEMATRIKMALGEVSQSKSEAATEWDPIDSLSKLRALVGGRFQNLKDRWIAAGLPLREHRGDKDGKSDVNQGGWIELSSWIAKQGYEARLTPESKEALFEIRKIR